MFDRSTVINAYRLFLGREPESEDVIDLHISKAPTMQDLRLRSLQD